MTTPHLLDIPFQILRHVPLFVWGLLALVLVMGRRQSRDQTVSRTRLLVLPALWLVFGALGVRQGFGHAGSASPAMAAWALGLVTGTGVLLASRWPGRARFQPVTGDFLVPGSWWPLAVMLALFIAKFVVGMTLARHPELAHSTRFAAGASLSFGLLGGFFVGRSLNILRQARQVRPSAAAGLDGAAPLTVA